MPNYRRFAVVASLLVVLFADQTAVHAQESTEEAKKLTGGTVREWLSGDVKTWMGTNPACSSGKIYRFSNDHTARIEECIDGKRQEKTLTWSMQKNGPLDTLITFDNKTYEVTFFIKQHHQYMILREGGQSKIDPFIDHTFVLSED